MTFMLLPLCGRRTGPVRKLWVVARPFALHTHHMAGDAGQPRLGRAEGKRGGNSERQVFLAGVVHSMSTRATHIPQRVYPAMWNARVNNRRSRLAILCLLSATVFVHASAALPTTTGSTSSIGCTTPSSSRLLHLYVINESGAGPQTIDAATSEAREIWAPAGLRLTWSFPPRPLDLTDGRTVIVVVRRALRRPPAVGAVDSKGSAMCLLGQVRFGEDGRPANLIEVSFEAITSLVMGGSHMYRPVAKLPGFLQQVLLGRGLGRVVAHEIGHWLVGRGHLQEGLMKRTFVARDLVEWNFPRLPRTWTAAGAGMLMARFSRCEPTPHAD